MSFIIKFFKIIILVCFLVGLELLLFFNFKEIQSVFENSNGGLVAFYLVWQGDEALKKRDFQKAVEYYRRGIDVYPQHIKARYNLGNIYFAYEDFVSASESYKEALNVDPGYLNARINLALIYTIQYRLDEAIEELEKAIETTPEFINIPYIYDNTTSIIHNKSVAYYNLGVVYLQKADQNDKHELLAQQFLNTGIRYFEKALYFDEKNFSAHYNIAVAYQRLNNLTNAGRSYCNAIKIDPYRFEPHYNLGTILKQQEKNREAVEEFKKATIILSAQGKYNEAENVSRTMLELVSKLVGSGELDAKEEQNKTYELLLKKLRGEILDPYLVIDKANITKEEEDMILTEDLKEIEWKYDKGQVKIPDNPSLDHPKMLESLSQCYFH